MVRTADADRYLDANLLHRLEVRRFGDFSNKRPRGQCYAQGGRKDTDEVDLNGMDKNAIMRTRTTSWMEGGGGGGGGDGTPGRLHGCYLQMTRRLKYPGTKDR
jgi:hypothetical protein